MANAQSVCFRGFKSRSHDGVTLRSGRRAQHGSPMARRQVTPNLERNLVDHRLGAVTATAPSSVSSSFLLMWLFFVTLIIRCRQIFMCLIFMGRGTHKNLSPMKIFPFTVYQGCVVNRSKSYMYMCIIFFQVGSGAVSQQQDRVS